MIFLQRLISLKVWKFKSGQDLIEYALMAGFVSTCAAAVVPGVATNISRIMSKVSSVLLKANGS